VTGKVRKEFGLKELVFVGDRGMITKTRIEDLRGLEGTETDLEKIRASVAAGRLKDPDKIGVRVGKVIGKHKVAKHFTWEITDGGFSSRRDEAKIAAEARLDGIYVIRTTMTAGTADTPGVVKIYKNLKYVERDFKTIKIDDLDIRPIRHYLAGRVEAHLLIAMLAAYLTWHLRKAFGLGGFARLLRHLRADRLRLGAFGRGAAGEGSRPGLRRTW